LRAILKALNFEKLYGNIGKFLCGIAGGIVGLFSGLYWVIPGVVLGIIIGHLLEKSVAKAKN